jgi:hypothetical protein
MRLKIIAKTPDIEESRSSSDLKVTKVFPGKLARVINAETGEELEGITRLELDLSPHTVIQAKIEFEVTELDIDVDVDVEAEVI